MNIQKSTLSICPPPQDLLSTKAPDRAATEIICHVHQHVVSFISMNQSGTLVATCSTKARHPQHFNLLCVSVGHDMVF